MNARLSCLLELVDCVESTLGDTVRRAYTWEVLHADGTGVAISYVIECVEFPHDTPGDDRWNLTHPAEGAAFENAEDAWHAQAEWCGIELCDHSDPTSEDACGTCKGGFA